VDEVGIGRLEHVHYFAAFIDLPQRNYFNAMNHGFVNDNCILEVSSELTRGFAVVEAETCSTSVVQKVCIKRWRSHFGA
jgi:hypothetical protein